MKALSTAGPAILATRRSGIVKPISAPIAPKAVIRYAYYAFIFSVPFEGFLGGLFFLGLILAGSTLCQPQLFLKRPPKAFWCFAIYIFLIGIFGLFGILEAPQDTEFSRAITTQIFRFFQLLIFFYIAYRLMTFEPIVKPTLLIFAIACVLVALLEASGVITIEVDPKDAAAGRMSMFGDNPNLLATLLGAGLLSLVGLAYGGKDMSMKVRLLAWLTSGLLLLAVVRTGARGNLLALMLALMVLTVKPSFIIERMKTILIAFLVIVSMAVASYQIDAVRERWERTVYEGDVAGRQILLPAAWGMFLEKPIIGWGPVSQNREMAARTGRPGGDVHNLYLWLLLELGLLGASPFFIGLWFCWRSAWHARRSVQGSLPLALLFFLLAVNMKGTYLYVKLSWVVLAYALASSSYAIASSRNYLQRFPAIAKPYARRARQMRKSFS
jgi:hypothetical protein